MLTKIEIEESGECTYYFDADPTPWSAQEFRVSKNRKQLTRIEELIAKFNEGRDQWEKS